MMKNTNTATTRKRKGYRAAGTRGLREIRVYDIRGTSAEGAR